MREFKFRIWDGQEREIIRNEDIKSLDFRANYFHTEMIDGDFFGDEYDYKLMQYTGLKDVEGNEIYEGDVIEKEFVDFSDRDNFKGVVKFIDGSWLIENENKMTAYFLFSETDINCIVGNIYENVKLLD